MSNKSKAHYWVRSKNHCLVAQSQGVEAFYTESFLKMTIAMEFTDNTVTYRNCLRWHELCVKKFAYRVRHINYKLPSGGCC